MTALPAINRTLNLRRRTRDEVARPKARHGNHNELVRKATEDTLRKHSATLRALAKV